jgi:hypothetical protein
MRCSVAFAAAILLASAATADPPGQSRSTFVPRDDSPRAGLAAPVLPAQKVETVPPSRGDPFDTLIRLEAPGRERLFGTLDTERELEERLRQERKDYDARAKEEGRTPLGPIVFPDKPELTDEAYQPRTFEPVVCLAEPSYVVYRRLYFEEKNAERYGWELGPLQPTISSLYFFRDVLLLPHNLASYPCRRFDSSAGHCLPGDPVPYILYPPEFTGSGLLAEVGAIALLAVSIP